MITLYYGTGSTSCRQTAQWFEKHGISFKKKRIERISKKDLISALSLSENGFSDLLKRSSLVKSDIKNIIDSIQYMTFNESIEYIIKHPNVLKVPLVIDENKIAVGYNTEEMRAFVPRYYRELELMYKGLLE